jgi:hypothetical protein
LGGDGVDAFIALIYAFEETNVAITGEGTLDGQGKSFFWKWHGNPNYGGDPEKLSQRPARAKLYEMMDKGIPVSERIFRRGPLPAGLSSFSPTAARTF